MCYCEKEDEVIFEDIRRNDIPEEAMVRNCCWKRICQVRGRYFESEPIDTELWKEICQKRGYLHSKTEPSGFLA